MQGKAYVNDIVMEAELMAKIAKDDKSKYSHINENSNLEKNVKIDIFTVIYDDVEIGDNCWIGPNVTILPGARIGKIVKYFLDP